LNDAATEIKKIFVTTKATELLINPFAHLSSNLAKPKLATELAKGLYQLLKVPAADPARVHYSPFGWYKQFDMQVLGHGDAQLFRGF
jgi:threonyl-tRNA synthetase